MAISQNEWTVVSESGTKIWNLPDSKRDLRLRTGHAGFVLVHLAAWFDENIEPLDSSYDDWGWSPRQIAGSNTWSNHASGTAIDLNAEKHPQGTTTYSSEKCKTIRQRLTRQYGNLVRWGGDYNGTVDEMHFEISANKDQIQRLYLTLVTTPLGHRIKDLNK